MMNDFPIYILKCGRQLELSGSVESINKSSRLRSSH